MRRARCGRLLERTSTASKIAKPQHHRVPVADWIIAIFAAIVQQGAFLSIPLYFGNPSLHFRLDQNDLNTVGVGISMVSIVSLCFWHWRKLFDLAKYNVLAVLFLVLALMSSFWSIHPDLSLRRGAGLILTILVAAIIALRFGRVDGMKVLSAGFAISAIGSILFVLVFPDDGIMRVADLVGTWRGIFPHKNVLGTAMAAAVFVELFIILSGDELSPWRLALMAIFLFLIVMSRSATGLLLAAFYLVGGAIYALSRRDALAGMFVGLMVALAASGLLLVLTIQPDQVLSIIGKDTTLTGRTEVWTVVLSWISERPWLGYGYRALWVLKDPNTVLADEALGGWGVGNSHNSFLELTAQLGYVGTCLMLVMIALAFWRASQCWLVVEGPLGFMFFMYLVATMFAAQTMESLGQNQVIEWVIFNVMFFGCGMVLSERTTRSAVLRRLPSIARPSSPSRSHQI